MGPTTPDRDLAVQVRDLVKIYPKPGGGTLAALNGVSFDVRQGEVFGFLGPNGAGKTTARRYLHLAIPFAAPIKAIRGIALDGVSITAYGTEALIGAGWLVLVFALAAKGYRFDRE